MGKCENCNKEIAKYATKYCSNKCQSSHNYVRYIEKWKVGSVDGSRGVSTKSLSRHIIRFIQDKYKMRCARCGWNEINQTIGRSALEVDHIDGNSDNNTEENLILLCPNCHSLTPNYKNLNKGQGRLWRREKYVKMV